jgi:hypothetical protein
MPQPKLPALPLRQQDSAAKDQSFLSAWEGDILPRSIDAATMLRIRQIKRANAGELKHLPAKTR